MKYSPCGQAGAGKPRARQMRARQAAFLTALLFCSFASDKAGATESFRQTCKDIRVLRTSSQTVVYASCDAGRLPDGRLGFSNNPTHLVVPPEGCADISNFYGKLRCNGAKHPGGSWQRSCEEGRFIRSRVFQAVCAPAGSTTPDVYSSIDMNTCPGFRLSNINGRLRCGN